MKLKLLVQVSLSCLLYTSDAGGQAKVGTAIKLLAQKDELSSALKVIVKEKNEQLSRAFDNVFIIGAIIVLICTPSALMTEKRKVE